MIRLGVSLYEILEFFQPLILDFREIGVRLLQLLAIFGSHVPEAEIGDQCIICLGLDKVTQDGFESAQAGREFARLNGRTDRVRVLAQPIRTIIFGRRLLDQFFQ